MWNLDGAANRLNPSPRLNNPDLVPFVCGTFDPELDDFPNLNPFPLERKPEKSNPREKQDSDKTDSGKSKPRPPTKP